MSGERDGWLDPWGELPHLTHPYRSLYTVHVQQILAKITTEKTLCPLLNTASPAASLLPEFFLSASAPPLCAPAQWLWVRGLPAAEPAPPQESLPPSRPLSGGDAVYLVWPCPCSNCTCLLPLGVPRSHTEAHLTVR